jgi:hypothetical protein
VRVKHVPKDEVRVLWKYYQEHAGHYKGDEISKMTQCFEARVHRQGGSECGGFIALTQASMPQRNPGHAVGCRGVTEVWVHRFATVAAWAGMGLGSGLFRIFGDGCARRGFPVRLKTELPDFPTLGGRLVYGGQKGAALDREVRYCPETHGGQKVRVPSTSPGYT